MFSDRLNQILSEGSLINSLELVCELVHFNVVGFNKSPEVLIPILLPELLQNNFPADFDQVVTYLDFMSEVVPYLSEEGAFTNHLLK